MVVKLWLAAVLTSCLLACATRTSYADTPSPKAVQYGVGYQPAHKCNANIGMSDLGHAYFGTPATPGQKPETLQSHVTTLLKNCSDSQKSDETLAALLNASDEYKIIVFQAKPTDNSPQAAVAHFIYHAEPAVTQGSTVLPGIKTATWIYITGEPYDAIVSQLVATPIDNPVLTQLGGLFAALEKPFEKILFGLDATSHELYLHVGPSVDLKFARGSIVETDFIATPKRDKAGSLIDSKDKKVTDANDAAYQQVKETFTLNNTPKTWITVNAAVAVLVGSVSGDQRMKVDNKAYASDPLTRGMAMAGVTLHVPYDPTKTAPSWQEIVGLFVGGVVSPTGGIAVGGSLGWKGLAMTAGYAGVFVQTAPSGKTAGDAVTAGLNPQLVTGMSKTAFLGATYAFK